MGSCRAFAIALGVALSTVAAAQPPTDAQKQQAGDLVKKAITKSQAGDHVLAIELYQQAYNIIPTPILLSNIGAEYQQANKPIEALKYFCRYLEADPAGGNAGYVIAQAKSLRLQQGDHVDDKDVCKPVVKAPTPPSTGLEPGSGSAAGVTGTAGLGSEPSTSAQPGPSKRLEYAGIAVGGAGAVATVLGFYFGVQAKSKSDYITNYTTDPKTAGMPWPQDIKQIEADGASAQTKQIVFLIAGGVGLVGGAAMIYLGHAKATATEHVAVRPSASANAVGVTLSGGF